MERCSNCNGPIDQNALSLEQFDVYLALICTECLAKTLTVKIVIRRPSADVDFSYDQFSPIEVESKK